MTHHFNNHTPHQLSQKMAYLDNKQRKLILPPEDLFAMIPLAKSDTILDLGAGTGFLTLPAAMHVEGTVYALDLSQDMLDVISSRAKEANLTNIEVLNTSIEALPLADNTINQVFASLVLHELPILEDALNQIFRVLRPGGHLVCLELEKSPHDHLGHPRLTAPHLSEALTKTGFTITKKSQPTPSLYVLIAQK